MAIKCRVTKFHEFSCLLMWLCFDGLIHSMGRDWVGCNFYVNWNIMLCKREKQLMGF